MKVLFSNPPWWVERDAAADDCGPASRWYSGVRAGSRWPHTNPAISSPDNFIFGEYLCYPFFMGYAATYARKATGADVRFRDSIALRESYASYLDHLRDERYDLIFIETATPCWDHDRALIGRIKSLLPDTRIALTGALSGSSERVLDEARVDAVIQGEYEKGSVRVIEGAEGVLAHDLLTVDEMNAAPFPYYDEVIAHRYWDFNPLGQTPPHAQVWSSRGCPYKCIFCVWPATMTGNDPDGTGKRSVRFYTPDYVEGLVTELKERYGFRSFYFDDDTFNLGDRHVLGICEVMKRVGVPWSAMCRADTISLDTWAAMRDAGCFGVKIGFESGNQWVNDNIVNKRLNLEKARDVVHELKRLGMTVHGTFTYGLPGETAEQMRDTKRYIASLPLDTFQETGTGEIEGTPLATLRQKGHLDRYKGAALDDNYLYVPDGGEKARRMAISDTITSTAGTVNGSSEFMNRQWDALAAAITDAAGSGPVAVWGIGTDFLQTVEHHPELAALLTTGRLLLADARLAGQTVKGVSVLPPSALVTFEGPVFMTSRMLATRAAMRQHASIMGMRVSSLRDVYETCAGA